MRHVTQLSAREYWTQFAACAGNGGAVSGGRSFSERGVGARSGTARTRAGAKGSAGHSGDAGQRAERRRLWLAAGNAGAERRGAAAHRVRILRPRPRLRRILCRFGPRIGEGCGCLQSLRRIVGVASGAFTEADARTGCRRTRTMLRSPRHRRRRARAATGPIERPGEGPSRPI